MPKTDALWQLYHENSKSSRFKKPLSDQALLKWQSQLAPSLGLPRPPGARTAAAARILSKTLEAALLDRVTAPAPERAPLPLETVATFFTMRTVLLVQTRKTFFHTVCARCLWAARSSAGIYFHAAAVDGLPPGLYHYEPHAGVVRAVLSTAIRRSCSRRVSHTLRCLECLVGRLHNRSLPTDDDEIRRAGVRDVRFARGRPRSLEQPALCTAATLA